MTVWFSNRRKIVRLPGVPLKEIPFKPNILLAVISHSGRVIIPRGDDCFMQGDSVVVVTTVDRNLGTLNDIFREPPQEGGVS